MLFQYEMSERKLAKLHHKLVGAGVTDILAYIPKASSFGLIAHPQGYDTRQIRLAIHLELLMYVSMKRAFYNCSSSSDVDTCASETSPNAGFVPFWPLNCISTTPRIKFDPNVLAMI